MRFEKKEPEIRIQPFNGLKNIWDRCRCVECDTAYTDEACKLFDAKGSITLAWHGQSITGAHLWKCAKCVASKKGDPDWDKMPKKEDLS